MSDSYARFESELTRLTREEVFASPALREEYRRRHHCRRWPTIVKRLWFVALIPTAVVIMPLSIFFPAFGLLAPDFIETPQPTRHFDSAAVLAAQSLMISAVGCFVLSLRPGELFCLPGHLNETAFFPVRDRWALNQALWGAVVTFGYFVYMLVLLYGALAWRDALTWTQIAGVGALAALQLWHLLSLSIIFAHWIPTRPAVMAVGLALALILFLSAGYPTALAAVSPQHEHAAALVVMLTPTGWINGALYYGIIQGNAAGWLFLAPVSITSAYAARWLRRGYAIREFRVSSQGDLTPVFEFGLPNARSSDEKLSTLGSEAPGGEREPEQVLEKRLLESPVLAPPDWRSLLFLERWIGELLTDRERTVLEQFYNGPPRWTAASLTFAGVWAVFLIIVVGVSSPEREWADFEPSVVLLLFPLLLGAMELCLYCIGRNNEVRTTPPLHPIFPIGLHETIAALKKSLALRAIFYLPFLCVMAVAETWWRPSGRLCALAIVLVVTVQAATAYLVVARMGFSMLNRYRFHWRRCVALTAIALAGTLSLPLLLMVHPVVSPALALLVLLLAYIGCRQFDRLYLDTEFDFEMPHPMAPIRPNQPRIRGW
jgi:hypothetical protein